MRDQHSQIVGCFFLLLLVPLLQIKPSDAAEAASDSIALGASLTGNETRISKGGTFKLGFFNLSNNNVKKWYVGIWYAAVSPQTVAWVANREQPLQNSSGVLNLTENGSLVLSYGGSLVWSSKGNGKKPSSAVITDNGNLVVLSAENTSESIWQSFDYPGDTWLPQMKISMSQRLISWKKPWDPSPGSFALEMDPNGSDEFVLMWENHTTYWDTGVWNGKYFPKVPDMTSNSIHNYSYFNNGSYKYFTYSYVTRGFLSRFVMDKSGKILVYIVMGNQWSQIWQQPLRQCDVYAVCGPYGFCNNNNVQSCNCVPGFVPKDNREWKSQQWSSGCVRKTPLQCSHSANQTTTDGFVELRGKSTPLDWVPYKGQGECKEACQGNCSCTAYAYVLNDTSQTSQTCVMWFGELLNLYDSSNGTSLFVRLDASDVPDSSNSNKKETLEGVIGGVVGGLIAILAFVFLFLWCCRRSPWSLTEYTPGTLAVFSYRELQNATKNFSERLGGGGFGSVFKGSLTDGSLVAVKKLEGVSQGEKQFRMEVSTIGTTQHVNLVRLRGFCTEGSSRLLVYEYMPNGSLNSSLFHKTQSNDQTQNKLLDWKTRFGIAVGTARGIDYLHEKCRDCIIHCDIKPENILLDSNFCPKVADFGLAKLLGREFSHALTTMRGTRGYLAPEWLSGLPITTKADVYSFGMTLLEIVSGRRNMDGDPESSEEFFPTWAVTQINSGNAMEVLDKKLTNDVDEEQVKRAAIVGGWCIQDNEDDRPSMSKVLQILEGVVDVPPLPPVPHSLQTYALKGKSLVFFWDKNSSEHNSNSDKPSTPV